MKLPHHDIASLNGAGSQCSQDSPYSQRGHPLRINDYFHPARLGITVHKNSFATKEARDVGKVPDLFCSEDGIGELGLG